jgi:hypothetical protein
MTGSAANKKLRVGGKSMVQIYHGAFMSLSDDASREVKKHRSASREGWPPVARGSRRGAERPRASLHSAKNRRAERSGHPSESTEWRIGRRPTPSSRRGAARAQGGFVPQGSPKPHAIVQARPRIRDGSLQYSSKMSTKKQLVRHSRARPSRQSPYGPHRASERVWLFEESLL